MANFTVTAEALRGAARNFETQVDAYLQATAATENAANTLAAGWAGESQKAFVAEQQRTIQ